MTAEDSFKKQQNKKKLIITFIIVLSLISIGIWYFFIDVQYERKITVKITNYGFWDKDNISFTYSGNTTKIKNITKEDKTFLFINCVIYKDGYLVRSIGGYLESITKTDSGKSRSDAPIYEINSENKTINVHGVSSFLFSPPEKPPEKLGNQYINNSSKVVLGKYVYDDISMEPDQYGWLLGYHTIPYNISEIKIYDYRYLYKTIQIKIDENYNVSVEGKKLNINDTIEFTYKFRDKSNPNLICFAFLILPIIIPSLMILVVILKKYYKN